MPHKETMQGNKFSLYSNRIGEVFCLHNQAHLGVRGHADSSIIAENCAWPLSTPTVCRIIYNFLWCK